MVCPVRGRRCPGGRARSILTSRTAAHPASGWGKVVKVDPLDKRTRGVPDQDAGVRQSTALLAEPQSQKQIRPRSGSRGRGELGSQCGGEGGLLT